MNHAVKTVAGYHLHTYVMSDQLRMFEGQVLVIHAPDDAEVAFSDAEAMAGAGAHIRLVPMPGLGHRRIIADERVFSVLRSFASERSIEAAEAA